MTPTLEERLRMRERPSEAHVMYQKWRSLLFLHFPCDPGEILPLLPPGLDVDLYPDAAGTPQAWVGLVPFKMEGVRPRFLPPVPGLSAFPEFNVRTYVHRRGRDPGVWFYSLDAANTVACRVARQFFGLPYFEAAMSVEEVGDIRRYRSRRRAHPAHLEVDAEFAGPLPLAEPGTLEFFLVERYMLYSFWNGRLFSGRVHHPPYPLRSAVATRVQESLTPADGLRPQPYCHTIASDGVDVKVYPLRPVEG
jgi:uncharacterized protein YqjF (DUF2071 family)